MFKPHEDGTLDVLGRVVGGHEVVLIGLDVAAAQVTALNSWGSGWGLNGRFKLSFSQLEWLLGQQGDATVLYR
jgi:hypothetical protein